VSQRGRFFRINSGALGVAFATVLGPALVACPDRSTGTVQVTAAERGLELYADPELSESPGNELACADCHALRASEGEGRYLPGAPLAGAVSRPSYWGGQETSLLASINHCRYYFMLSTRPWTGEEEEAKAIYALLESLEATPEERAAWPFTLGEVILLEPGDPVRGEAIYAAACGTCHGDKASGAGASVPGASRLPDQTLAEHPPPEYGELDRFLVFVEKTRNGLFRGYGGTMPPFSAEVLSDEELAHVLSYLEVPRP
jgi:thiosulfate dehydrogenase